MIEHPSLETATSGSIRFNTDSSKLEIYNGEAWWNIDSTSPEEQTGGTRGVIMGGLAAGEPNGHNVMQFITVSSTGNSADFGDLTRKKYASYGGIASRTRGIMPGGYYYNMPAGPGTYTDEMDAITISIQSNAFDFGDLVQGNRAEPGSASNETRGIIFGGTDPSVARTNTITYVTIATLGGGIDFGDMIGGLFQNPTGTASPTRVVMGTGEGSPANFNSLEYITISTLGNGANFGETSVTASYRTACGNAVRGLIAGGYAPSSNNTIEFITIATQGNAQDFGDLTNVRGGTTSMASPVRGVFAGGRTPTEVNTIDYVQIPSTGNASDFGDLLSTVSNACSVSNGHGGLG
jgi:hypothetical protein